jgi:monothiol glutaredoxin
VGVGAAPERVTDAGLHPLLSFGLESEFNSLRFLFRLRCPMAEEHVSVQEFIRQTVTTNPVVLFMKGTAQFPQCGFSGRAISLLKANGVRNLVTVNVLDDEEVRQGIKEYANWPTVPQLYIKGEFIGGADILGEMHESGELKQALEAAQS